MAGGPGLKSSFAWYFVPNQHVAFYSRLDIPQRAEDRSSTAPWVYQVFDSIECPPIESELVDLILLNYVPAVARLVRACRSNSCKNLLSHGCLERVMRQKSYVDILECKR